MRHLTRFALLLARAAGCSKKKPTEPADGGDKKEPPPADTTAADRTRLLNALKSSNEKTRLDAVDELSAWVDSDPEAAAGLLGLLKDKATAGPGKTHPFRIASTREAATRALLLAGPKGEAVLKA